jgi:hypothetical protein
VRLIKLIATGSGSKSFSMSFAGIPTKSTATSPTANVRTSTPIVTACIVGLVSKSPSKIAARNWSARISA